MPVPSRYSFQTRLIRGFTLRLLSRVIFVNHMTRNAYRQLFKAPESRCLTIYNGVDTGKFSGSRSRRVEVRQKLGLKEQDVMVITTGNLTPVKGQRVLIQAIENLVRKQLAIHCFIVGEGESRKDLEEQITLLGLERSVELLGYRDDIPSMLSGADIFCFPSLNEALGFSLLEAMASGLPVVASNVGGIPEVVTHGREGLLVPPGRYLDLSASIEQLAKDAGMRREMGNEGRKRVKEVFSLESMLARTKDLFFLELNG